MDFLVHGNQAALGWYTNTARVADYKTIFGPMPAHKGVLYDNDPGTLLSASTRLTAAKRTPDETLIDVRSHLPPLFMYRGLGMQRELFDERQEYQLLWREIPNIVYENDKQKSRFQNLAAQLGTHEGSLEAYALSPHAKLAPRTASLQTMRAKNWVGKRSQKRKASAKVKRLEWAAQKDLSTGHRPFSPGIACWREGRSNI
jgi:hypothetical protein